MSKPPMGDQNLIGLCLGGRYVLEQPIATGGMGTIWRALDRKFQWQVAVKLLAADRIASSTAKQRVAQEAMAVARLHRRQIHPHVVQIHDYEVDGDRPYIVMELLDGEDLDSYLSRRSRNKENSRLEPEEVVPWLNQLADALSVAHAAGVIHRDLKPANIFHAQVGGKPVLKVVDFGLALLDVDTNTPVNLNELAGTFRYMSLEQLRGQDLGPRTDLWSLAIVLYQFLAGYDQFPYSKADVLVALGNNGSLAITPPSSIVPKLGAAIDAFFAQALAPDPAQRFSKASDMAHAFSKLVEARRSALPAKILVVDDEPDMALVMQQRFRKQIQDSTYEFVFASNGEEALERLRQHPDTAVVLSDLNMPKMDGLTFLGRVGEVNSLVKVVIVSAYSDMSNIRTAMNRGAFDFLVKPINFQDLKTTLEKTLKHVVELRQMLRSHKENDLLRMFVQERVLDVVRAPLGVACERVEGTVIFIDVKDFTPMTRGKSPEVALQRLTDNLEVIVPELTSQGGVVDKFVGDAVMAVFRGQDHLERALDACLSVKQQLQDLAHRSGDKSSYTHGVCIGLASGVMLSGSIGAKALGRLDYTMLGDVVNTASWLAALADRNQILIPEDLGVQLDSSFECMTHGVRPLPGTRAPIKVHEVIRRRQTVVSAADATASVDRPKEREQPLMAALKATPVGEA